jgi:hypothetical protein
VVLRYLVYGVGEKSVSSSNTFTQGTQTPVNPTNTMLGGSQSQTGFSGEQTNSLHVKGIEPRIVQKRSLDTILTELSRQHKAHIRGLLKVYLAGTLLAETFGMRKSI